MWNNFYGIEVFLRVLGVSSPRADRAIQLQNSHASYPVRRNSGDDHVAQQFSIPAEFGNPIERIPAAQMLAQMT